MKSGDCFQKLDFAFKVLLEIGPRNSEWIAELDSASEKQDDEEPCNRRLAGATHLLDIANHPNWYDLPMLS
ncbi:hypothetical protein AMECASPLE_033853 [Ameca splendens]|uniref:Uncharacterized protein n=1 Tax=Ameca splendens TaxID=208324 RepID=A0ABV0XK42_9TELE